jgi:hypothetical protein
VRPARRPRRSFLVDPVRIGTPLLGLSIFAPPSTCLPSVHSRSCPGSEEPPVRLVPRRVRCWQETYTSFGSKMPPFELVPPLPFLPASAAFSAGEIAGFLHPAANHGVRHVSGPWFSCLSASPSRRVAARPATCAPCEVQASVAALPPSFRASEEARPVWLPVAGGSHDHWFHSQWRYTLRSFPLADSRATSPWSLPSRHQVRDSVPLRGHLLSGMSRRGFLSRPPDLRALLHRRVRCGL